MSDTHKGKCFCGAVEIEAQGAPMEMGYCHCQSCRSYSGSPITSFLLWKAEDVRVTKGAEVLGCFMKSAMSDRLFCARCGGHLMTHHPELGVTDVRPPAMPGIDFKPVVHLNYAEAVLPMKDGLPKLRDFPAQAGGSGATIAE